MCLPGTIEAVREQIEKEGAPRIDRRAALVGGAAAALAATFPGTAAARRIRVRRVQDLTHTFTAGFPVFTGDSPAKETIATIDVNGFYSQGWTFGEHSGTHMDAPGHFTRGGRLAPDLRPRELIVPLVVIDISERARRDPDAEVRPRDLRRFERRHGRIPDGALVAMDSGWAEKVDDPLAFKGGDSFPNFHFPGFGADAIEWLLERRDVKAIGVDTMSLDPGNSTTFPVHVTWLGQDKYGLENLANLDKVRPRGATAFVGLIPWEDGSGGPCRVIAVS